MSDEKNKYITAYGSSNADSYGRGDVTDVSTKYNMLTTNPLSDENAPEMNSCSSDGSYNQDIFGWKCFNSPVSFRNGIYGECGYVTTFSDSAYHGIKIETYDTGDSNNKSKIIIKADHIKLDGTVDDLTANNSSNLVYNNGYSITTVVTANSATSVIPSTDNTVSLGTTSKRFSTIYGNVELNSDLSITTQYTITDTTPADRISDTITSNLADHNIAIKLPKRTYITTPDSTTDDVYYVGRGNKSDAINLPLNETTYLETNRVAPGISNASRCCVGTSTLKYGDVWANNLHGCIPYPTDGHGTVTSDDLPIGSIIMAYAQYGLFSDTSNFGPGQMSTVTISGTPQYKIYRAEYNADTGAFESYTIYTLNHFKWVALSGGSVGSLAEKDKYIVVLVMRVE